MEEEGDHEQGAERSDQPLAWPCCSCFVGGHLAGCDVTHLGSDMILINKSVSVSKVEWLKGYLWPAGCVLLILKMFHS